MKQGFCAFRCCDALQRVRMAMPRFSLSAACLTPLRVEFLLKTDSGYPMDTGLQGNIGQNALA